MSSMQPSIRFACDAMCGGLARWLRGLGYDATWTEGIDDAEVVEQARRDGRVLISSDGGIFERRIVADGTVRSLRLPRGLKLLGQVEYVVRALGLTVHPARCMACNGELRRVERAEVGDRVPARSLLWATEFFECRSCGRVVWNGTHWRRIEAVRRRMGELGGAADDEIPPGGEDRG